MSVRIQNTLAVYPSTGEPWVPELSYIEEQPFFKLTLGSQQFRHFMQQLSFRDCLGFSASSFFAELRAARSLACKPPEDIDVGQDPFAKEAEEYEMPAVVHAVLEGHPQGGMRVASVSNPSAPVAFAFTAENLEYVRDRLLADYNTGFERVKRQTRKVHDNIAFMEQRNAFSVKYKCEEGRLRVKTFKINDAEGGRDEALEKATTFRDGQLQD
jgi:hypothetical protein